MQKIPMVDLVGQYNRLKNEIDDAIQIVLNSAHFIKGPIVKKFEESFANYLSTNHVISCGNGTDALQIALMALNLNEGDEVIVPSFTYAATAEVIALLKLTPIMVDVDPQTFNITAELITPFITPRTKAIIPVHLFGQCSDMESIMKLAKKHNLYVIEDNAQAIGADYTFSDGQIKKAGTIGHIGCTSFFPSKNLGCFGDGGAIFTDDSELAERIRCIANHGQSKKYHHAIIGVNSRLDAIQAAVLTVKLNYLEEFKNARNKVADEYDLGLKECLELMIPKRQKNSSHVFHQYTILVRNGKRNELQTYLKKQGIPSVIYYPIPLYKQEAYKEFHSSEKFDATEFLCESVLSLPIHTEMEAKTINYIIKHINLFFKQ